MNDSQTQNAPSQRIVWLSLLTPPVLTFGAAALGGNDTASFIMFIASGLGALVGGISLGLKLGKTEVIGIGVGLLLSLVLFPVMLFACLVGCALGHSR